MILNIDFVGRNEVKVLEAEWARNAGIHFEMIDNAKVVEIIDDVKSVNGTEPNEAKRKEAIKDSPDAMSFKQIRHILGDCFVLIRFHAMAARDFILCLSKYVEMFNCSVEMK